MAVALFVIILSGSDMVILSTASVTMISDIGGKTSIRFFSP